nr:glycoside hydrolase family 3 protein [uncultured Blautia sp.]
MSETTRKYSGTTDRSVTERELRNRKLARKAAAEGMVLLKNEGILPLQKNDKIALFGGGAVATVKGGTGSGDVNEREVVSIYQGLQDAGLEFTNKEWLEGYIKLHQEERLRWRDMLQEKLKDAVGMEILDIYSTNPFHMPAGAAMKESDVVGAKAVFYVISRKAGEGADRFKEAGDYDLSKTEKEELRWLDVHCENLVVVINAGGLIDLSEIMKLSHLKALLSIVQPGMEGGHALADIVTGEVTPCGKLTDTWAKDYFAFPCAGTFSHMNGNVEKEYYQEGIYVGYRYFDSFEKEVEFPFGFGLSYTEFQIVDVKVEIQKEIRVTATIKNIGSLYSGKEVLQVYATCPQSGMEKEYKRLCGFAKTDLLTPGESQQLTVTFDEKALASFSEKDSAWVIEAGKYGIWAGNSSQNITLAAVLEVKETTIIEKTEHICPVQEELTELECSKELRIKKEQQWHELAAKNNIPTITFTSVMMEKETLPQPKTWEKAREITEKLTDEELIAMVIGEISKGQGQALGSAGNMVPGAAGETSSALKEKYGIPGASMADGPAGIRLNRSYQVDKATGDIYSEGILDALEGGFLAFGKKHENAETYYQYCTAIPVGTLLAQTWDVNLMEEVGKAVAAEMQEFGISWWLAPGMNIHRNPLCGRNFEYYSEDPLVSGAMAAAITKGVQSVPGVGTTIKHFACNNQEDNRMGVDSVVSERVLREIYIRGFEIAVKQAQPMAIMTSYNLVNGVHAANNKNLCTQAARKEWNFQGIIMTDWTTTEAHGGSTSWKCPWAGNDLIMPGGNHDVEGIRKALESGELTREELKACVTRLLSVILQTLACGCGEAYEAQFD